MDSLLRTNFKTGVFICLLILVLKGIYYGMSSGYHTFEEENVLFMFQVAAILGLVICAIGLFVTRNKSKSN
jgi:hypothetical protein